MITLTAPPPAVEPRPSPTGGNRLRWTGNHWTTWPAPAPVNDNNVAINLPALEPLSPRRSKAAPRVARLTLTIGATAYTVRPLAVEPGSGIARLVRLRKDAATAYHVHRDEDGICGCDCADFEFRHRDNGSNCKHILILAAVGLI